jgi:hypothetical protein
MATYDDTPIGWDDAIGDGEEPPERTVLAAGRYPFVVEEVKRGYFNGSEKLAECPCADIRLRFSDGQGQDATVFDRVFLIKRFEWKISALFRAVGHKRKGDDGFRPDWGRLEGASGEAQLKVTSYQGQRRNEVERYFDAAQAQPQAPPAPAQQPVQPQPVAQPVAQPAASWQPGSF